jgi:hypothetical protein
MKQLHLLILLCVSAPLAALAEPAKPAALPGNYRDIQIYTTSRPDPDDAAALIATVHFVNRSERKFRVGLQWSANDTAGLSAGNADIDVGAATTATRDLTLRPTDALQYEILHGEISFGSTPARELFIAVQRIDDAVRVVGTHAPRFQIDWWRGHDSSSLRDDQRIGPKIILAAGGESEFAIVCEAMPRTEDGSSLTLDAWSEYKPHRSGESQLIDAIRDLQHYIGVMSGGGEMRITGIRPKRQAAIVISIDATESWPHNDAFRLRTTEAGDLLITAGELDGLRQGIYRFLTRHLNCHWFMPAELGAEIPKPVNGRVVIGKIDETGSPSFFSNRGTSWGGADRWDHRNKSIINQGRMAFGHAWTALLSKNDFPYEEHPDMWAKDRDGKLLVREASSGQTNFCSTSPEVMAFVAKKINQQLSDPNALIASLDPNDYSPMCLCPRCLALDEQYGVKDQDGKFVSDRLLHFSQEIHDRLEPQNKDKFLGILVYAYQIELPIKAKPHKNHTGMVCNMGWTYDHTRPFTDPTAPTNVKFYDLLKGWGELLTQFGYYDYYGHWRHFGPWGQIYKMREDLPAFRDVGGTYLMLECQPNFAMQGLNHYIAGRLSWDVDVDVDVLLEAFFAGYHGPAAAPMRDFYMDIEKYYALLRPGPNAGERVRHTPGFWENLQGHLDAAQAIVVALPEEDKRFKDRVAFTRDGFEIAWRQYQVEKDYVSPGNPPRTQAEKLKLANESLTWFATMEEKYPAPYWPLVLPSYFYPRVEQVLNKAKQAAEAKLKE